MFFKKIAMVIIAAGFASGILFHPVSGQAAVAAGTAVQEDQTAGQNIGSGTKEDDSSAGAMIKDTGNPQEGSNSASETRNTVVNTPAPAAATPQVVQITSNITTTTGNKGVKPKKKAKKYTKAELRLMASIINCEAGGESFQGKVAVGIVVMNRVKSDLFPNSIKKVIYQKGQFSPVRNGSLRKKLKQYDAGKIHSAQWKSCIKAAKQALNGKTVIRLKGKTKSMKGVRFFSVYLKGAKFRLGGHRFR